MGTLTVQIGRNLSLCPIAVRKKLLLVVQELLAVLDREFLVLRWQK